MTFVALLLKVSPLQQMERKEAEHISFCSQFYPAVLRLLATTQNPQESMSSPKRNGSTWVTIARLENTPFKDHLRVTLCGQNALSDAHILFTALAEQPILCGESLSYRVLSVDLACTPWATVSSWTDLLAPPPHLSLTLHFVTPTIFLGKDEAALQEDIFPQPWLVFEMLLDRWRRLHGPTLSQQIIPWLQHRGCVVSEYNIQAVPIAVRKGAGSSRIVPGWTGSITYTCLERYSPSMASVWALARLAVFVGAGTNTEVGLGVTQVVEKG